MKALMLLLAITLVPFTADAAQHSGKQAKPSRRLVPLPTPEENQGSIDSYRRAVKNYGPGWKIPCMSGPRRRCL